MKYLLLVGIAVGLFSIGTGGAMVQAQSVEDVFAQGVTAFEQGQYDEAAILMQQVARRDRRNPEASYILARIYLETPLQDWTKAEESIKRALTLDPQEVRFLELRLRQYRQDTTNKAAFMERIATRQHLAERILKQAPLNTLALLERGRVSLDHYDWYTFKAATRQTKYFERKREAAYATAESALLQVLEVHPEEAEAYRLLMRLYAQTESYPAALDLLYRMKQHRPADPFTWLYLGFVHHNQHQPAEAAQHFEHALSLMEPAQHAVFTDLSFVLNDAQLADYRQDPVGYARAFWAIRDARLLTVANERLNEHYARLVYTDLFFSDGWHGIKGWNTRRGDIFLRYGKPENFPLMMTRYGFIVEMERLVQWHYGDFDMVFQDEFRSGHYQFYETPGEIGVDYGILARTQRRDLPQRYRHQEPGRRVDFPYLVSAFKGAGNRTDLYVPYGIPLAAYDASKTQADLRVQSGAFLIEPGGVIHRQTHSNNTPRRAPVVSFVDTALWIDYHRLQVAPGVREVAVEFEVEEQNTLGYRRAPITVKNFATDSLQISDILLAYGVEEAREGVDPRYLVRGEWSIAPAPWGVFAQDQPLYLYFELYNLTPDVSGAARYDVEAVLLPREDDATGVKKLWRGVFGEQKETGVASRFSRQTVSQEDGQYLILDTSNQPKGHYVLVLQVIDTVTGAQVEARRNIMLE